MPLILGKIKCYFCNKKEGFMHSVHAYGIYGNVRQRQFYHPECLEMIEMDPEKWGHIMADKALHIHELKDSNMKENVEMKQAFIERSETLQKKHFERLMPKKT